MVPSVGIGRGVDQGWGMMQTEVLSQGPGPVANSTQQEAPL